MIALIVNGRVALGRDPKFELKEQMGKFALPLTMPKVGDIFGIGFYPPETPGVSDDIENEAFGRIQLGDKWETFASDISYWKIPQYTKQWHEGLQRLLDGAESTCLLVCVTNPNDIKNGIIDWWRLYREGDRVIVTNQLNALPLPEGSFDLSNPYKHINPHTKNSVYEWETSIEAIRVFFESLK